MTRTVLFTGDIFRQQPRGGITRYVLEVLARLRRPAELVLGPHQSQDAGLAGVPARFALRLPPWRGMHRLAGAAGAWVDAAALRGRRGVIVHPSYYRDPAGLPPGEPVVTTVHDMTHERCAGMFPGGAPAAGDPARHKAALCARADRVVCYSQSAKRDVVELLGVPEAKVRVAPLASRDWAAVAPVPLGAPRPFVLWVGERHAYKNFARTLEAFAATPAAAGHDLLLAGGGPPRPHEREAIARLGIAARVRQRALADGELRWAYEHAAALAYPSLHEGFGLPVAEALALGCPVVTSNRSSLPEVGGEAAIYADPDDTESLRDGLARAIGAGRAAADVAARRAQAARFSWRSCAEAHEALYAELDG